MHLLRRDLDGLMRQRRPDDLRPRPQRLSRRRGRLPGQGRRRWSPPSRRSASGASSTGAAFPANRSATAWPKPASRWATSATSRSTATTRANRWRKLAYVLTSGVEPRLRPEAPAPARRPRRRRRQSQARICPSRNSAAPCMPSSTISAISPRPSWCRPTTRRWRCRSTASAISRRRAWGLGEGGKLAVDGRVYFPHSLGVFYEAMTQFIGFPHYGDEYKVMGLAPYGEPRYVDADEADRPAQGRRQLRARPALLPARRGRGRQLPGEGRHPVRRPAVERRAERAARAGARSGGAARGHATATSRARRRSTYENAFFNLLRRAAPSATAPTPSCWRAAAPTTRWPTARSSSARRSRSSMSSRPAAMPAARSARPSPPGTSSGGAAPSATS